MPFEVFRGRGRRNIGGPAVTLTKAGNINLNRPVLEQIGDDVQFAHLMFDRDTRRIGLKFMKKAEDRYAYPLKRNENNNSAMVSGRAFMTNYQIAFDKTHSYDATVDKSNNTVIVDLNRDAGSEITHNVEAIKKKGAK